MIEQDWGFSCLIISTVSTCYCLFETCDTKIPEKSFLLQFDSCPVHSNG